MFFFVRVAMLMAYIHRNKTLTRHMTLCIQLEPQDGVFKINIQVIARKNDASIKNPENKRS